MRVSMPATSHRAKAGDAKPTTRTDGGNPHHGDRRRQLVSLRDEVSPCDRSSARRGGPWHAPRMLRLTRAGTVFAALVTLSMGCDRSGSTSVPPQPDSEDGTQDPKATDAAPLADEVVQIMDHAASPCDDFYRYACGGWIDATEIPGHLSRYGRFHALRERNTEAMRDILAAPPPADASEDRQRLATFYAACMDEEAIDAAGLAPLSEALTLAESVEGRADLMTAVGKLHAQGADALFGQGVGPDDKNPEINLATVSQGGLGLPDRDYYLREGDEAQGLRDAYRTHIEAMLTHAGHASPAEGAKRVVAFETALARASTPRDQLRDPDRRYNKVDSAALRKMAPGLPWKKYFAATGHPAPSEINAYPESFFGALAKLVAKTDASTLQDYLRWQVLHDAARHLPGPFRQAHFEFYDQRLRGQREMAPRWKQCVEATDGALGEALGQVFVERHFAGDSKTIALDMIHAIEAAFAAGLPSLSWMDEETRRRALEKMRAIVNKIGYPDRWRDYAQVAVGDGHLANVVAARRFEFDRRAREIGKAVDDLEWHMTPPTVNAYYNPSNNEMVFPAGILQRPFFDAGYPMAMNFGGIGMVMGHELTHGFDDQGRKYDGTGKLTEWWGPDAVKRFEERAQCVEKLYGGYEVQPGVTLNGKLTLGENIADFGGIKDAFRAWRAWADENEGGGPPAVDGLTNDQLFFVAFGQIWCTKSTAESERVLALTDPHSSPRYRVNGPLSNLPEFWDTFACEQGDAMRPVDTCEVW